MVYGDLCIVLVLLLSRLFSEVLQFSVVLLNLLLLMQLKISDEKKRGRVMLALARGLDWWRGLDALCGTGRRGYDKRGCCIDDVRRRSVRCDPSKFGGTSRLHNVVFVHRLFNMCLQELPQCYVQTATVSLDHCS